MEGLLTYIALTYVQGIYWTPYLRLPFHHQPVVFTTKKKRAGPNIAKADLCDQSNNLFHYFYLWKIKDLIHVNIAYCIQASNINLTYVFRVIVWQ